MYWKEGTPTLCANLTYSNLTRFMQIVGGWSMKYVRYQIILMTKFNVVLTLAGPLHPPMESFHVNQINLT